MLDDGALHLIEASSYLAKLLLLGEARPMAKEKINKQGEQVASIQAGNQGSLSRSRLKQFF